MTNSKLRCIGAAVLVLVLAFALSACGDTNTNSASHSTNGASASNSDSTNGQAQNTGDSQQPMQWSKPPEMTIDPNKTYDAVLHTSDGDLTIELFAKDAPVTVNNFVFLAKQHFYDGITFHRIIQSFMIQTGDPTGTGAGGPGYQFNDELPSPYKYEKGIVAMANAGANTNGSQFFICSGSDSQGLNAQPNYTIFGKVVDGMDTVDKIAATPVGADSRGEVSKPLQKVTINSIDIEEK